jgi:hypothetical protein
MDNTKHPPPLSDETRKQIVERWRHSLLNSIPKLVDEFKCSKSQVHKAINDYLSTKIKS